MTAAEPLTESSPSVQAHLQIIQSVIERMANNSASCKAWCITLVSAILVIVADKKSPDFVVIAFVPVLFFLALDAYYLALEQGFRVSYNDFVRKIHKHQIQPDDLFVVGTAGRMSSHELKAIRSFSVWGFYGPLVLAIELVCRLVLGA